MYYTAVYGAQVSLDPKAIRAWLPNLTWQRGTKAPSGESEESLFCLTCSGLRCRLRGKGRPPPIPPAVFEAIVL